MLFRDEHTPSLIPKSFFMFSIIMSTYIAGYLMFANIDDMSSWLQPYKTHGTYARQLILISCLIFYIFRLGITTFVFLKRKLVWGEAILIAGLMSLALFSFAYVGGGSQKAINILDYSGIILFLVGSWINTQSEYTRYIWKQNVLNKGKLYTGGLFKYSMHINYFGDLILFIGLALITQTFSLLIIPLVMALNFVIYVIPSLNKYLENKYSDDFKEYASKTKKLIPGIY